MIAATGSGSGKTTVVCSLLAALTATGKNVISFKCGPDYIDPMFHRKATGVEARNLDVFLMGEEGVKYGAAIHAENKDIAVYEGVMGLYDGQGSGSFASSNHVSLLTNTPVILVVDVKGAALSLCATIKGFMEFERNNIQGVLLNNASEAMYHYFKAMIEERLAVSVVGYLPPIPEARIESRHLGLIPAGEIADIKDKIAILRDHALRCIDMETLLRIAGEGKPFPWKQDFLSAADRAPETIPYSNDKLDIVSEYVSDESKATIYVSSDEAFTFWYEDNHDLWRSLGAELRFFSPLRDETLPNDADGLVLWGGYPELHGETLENNTEMKRSIRAAIDKGLPVYAEGGGFMYLQQSLTDLQGNKYEMLGALPGNVQMTPKLQDFGYYRMEARCDNMLCRKGGGINGHIFHSSVSDREGDCFHAVKASGKAISCVVAERNIFAGYQQLHFWGNPGFAASFLSACIKYRNVRVK